MRHAVPVGPAAAAVEFFYSFVSRNIVTLVRIAILIAVSATGFSAIGAECTPQQEIAAERTVSTLRNWKDVHSAFVRFRRCDDGAIGEGFSDSVSILFAEHWDQLGALLRLAARDRSFRQFVLRHLDETVPADRWSAIEENAKSRCPSNARFLCRSILSRGREIATNPAVNMDLAPKASQGRLPSR
ncbi:hypothetical protein [Rubrivivax gelatinosus]|uniref:hypothetical protein n=1 Tax=Rubrivivax gelatinosus TaxID=28068 RepID=UPI0011D27DC8|nr:hypothetical protein [Rubrivivax gelatinosus]